MKLFICLFLAVGSTFGAAAQVVTYDLYFHKDQTELDEGQKIEILNQIDFLGKGSLLTIYPLTLDTVNHIPIPTFTSAATEQANSIASFAASEGFELIGIPSNFPAKYKGRSIGVNLKYNPPLDFRTAPKDYSFRANTPQKESQFFDIDPLRDTIIIGEEGTIIHLKANCLQTKKPVTVELKEYYKLSDYITNELPTASNNTMIQTGGSIFLNATESESKRAVTINPSIGVNLEFTIGKTDNEMEIFTRDRRKQNTINWIPQKKRDVRTSWQMTETILDYDGSVISEITFTSKEEWEKYKADERERAADIERQQLLEDEYQSKVNKALSVYNFGFINCDKFVDEPLMAFNITVDTKQKADYFLVFEEVRGMLQASVSGSTVSFGEVPMNKTATLLAVSYLDKEIYYGEMKINTNTAENPKIALKRTTQAYIDASLAALN